MANRVDRHCHIIWGVDDGSESREMSIAMLDAAKDAGVTELHATPHMRWDDFDMEVVRQRYAELKEQAAQRGINTKLGFEVYYKTLMRQGLEHAPEYVLEDTDRILIEFNSGADVPHDFFRNVYRLQSEYGLEVTVAHPERYGNCQKDFKLVEKLKDAGCRIQVSAGDLEGGFFDKCAKCAKRIVKEGLCDELVSDAHRPDHYTTYAKLASKFGS